MINFFSKSNLTKTFFLILLLQAACAQKKTENGTTLSSPPEDRGDSQQLEKLSIEEKQSEIENIIQKHELYRYPTLTTLLAVKNVEDTREAIEAAGGTIEYDPNLGRGSEIGFLIVNLPPEKLQDKDFIKSLNLESISLSHPAAGTYKLMANTPSRAFEKSVFVPIEDVKLPQLKKEFNQDKDLGEGVTIAVIDSGIDAAHPVFQNRVIYWSDETEETHVNLNAVFPNEKNQIQLELNGKMELVELPKTIKSKKFLSAGVIKEAALAAQVSFDDKLAKDKIGLDLNQNGLVDDEFVVVSEKVETKQRSDQYYLTYIDLNGDGNFNDEELSPIVDFNEKRAGKKASLTNLNEFVTFPARNQTLKLPLLLATDSENNLLGLRLGFSDGSHGTHVAGIAAGNGMNVVGAAPLAKLMSIKVCSGITCTTDAILRGLIETFYHKFATNPELIPDVVNISLGSHQKYSQDIFDLVIRDLTAKFGTIFVVSASNSGPGHRSLNSIASFGPGIQVGAHVSKKSLQTHYLLDPAVAKDMPTNHLLFFSSLGPSYTGHLRPNIIAPGSALSSTTLTENGLAMFNGTSMSSPLAAGSIAALLSIAKKDANYQNSLQKRKAKIASIQDEFKGKDANVEYGLSGLAMAMRSALEETATSLEQYTMLQQGHGLIDTKKAYKKFIELSNKWANEEARYFEVKINGNLASHSFYSRKSSIEKSASAVLSLEADGEMSEVEKLAIQSTPIKVKLEKVEVQDSQGKVEVLKDNLPFSIATRGIENQGSREASVVITNRRNDFVSLRRLNQMQSGKTYTAHYALYQNGIRIQSLVDVVHKPIELSSIKNEVVVPSITPIKLNLVNAYAQSSVKINANSFHRYLVAVDSQDSELIVQLGILNTVAGAAIVTVYDPTGEELEFSAASNSNEVKSANPTIVKYNIDTRSKPGIYEVTVATSASGWMAPTEYDLLINTNRLESSIGKEKLKLAGGASKIIAITHPTSNSELHHMPKFSLKLTDLLKVSVLPGRWSFKKIQIPADTKDITVDFKQEEYSPFFGSVVPYLFENTDTKNLKVLMKADSETSNLEEKELSFVSDDFPSEAYIAIETIGVVPETGTLKGSIQEIAVNVSYATDDQDELVVETLKKESNNKTTLLKVSAPKVTRSSTAKIELLSDNAELVIPVIVSPVTDSKEKE